ncbi:YbaY family lipoprotein [Variovorax sp. J22G73]|uniref:YbaY family lipoprotein n=1 Tax=unclassified Variovorax TaxID=663243 RepID=UPI000D5F682E|nr:MULTISPECIES: YbaY family lipoprotein [unclassified Variovorax]MDM0008514.1 YbaY family lipoprotein [Variovorax sp. J22R203]MDM0101021.1 YbaY family lipoprotein [Variovorax sp. J22G73]
MNRRTNLLGFFAWASASLLSACAMPSTPSTPAASGASTAALRVSGTVAYRERMALDPKAVVVVQLLDVSRMDAPSTVLAEQRIEANGRQPPFAYELKVDVARIDPRMRYAVSARILRGEQLLFINDTQHPVLTQGAGASVDLVLVRVAQAPR